MNSFSGRCFVLKDREWYIAHVEDPYAVAAMQWITYSTMFEEHYRQIIACCMDVRIFSKTCFKKSWSANYE